MKRTISIALVAVPAFIAGVYFVSGGASLLGTSRLETAGNASPVAPVTVPGPVASVENVQDSFASVAEAVNPTVVQIRSATRVRQPVADDLYDFFDFFRRMPRDEQMPEQEDNRWREDVRSGLGSGVIARSNGYIITNHHVVDGADELEVKLFDGRGYDAELIGSDPLSDLAVIKIEVEEELPYIGFADESDIRVGQWVLAFGSPLAIELSNTVTAGIVSALGRAVRLRAGNSEQAILGNLIQTDAAINPGNSGGPLVNLQGRLVGINNAIVSRSGGNMGIGFSIPISTVNNVVNQLIEEGRVARGYLGIQFRPVTEALADALSLSEFAAEVVEVVEGEAAEKAGIEVGDIIVAIDGSDLQGPDELRVIVANSRAGEELEVELLRDDERMTVTVELGEYPDELLGATAERSSTGNERLDMEEDLGFSMQTLTPDLKRRFQIDDTDVEGVLVIDVDRTSDAYREAELRPRDIIVSIDRTQVSNVSEFESAYEDIEPGSVFLMRVYRDGNTFRTALTKPR